MNCGLLPLGQDAMALGNVPFYDTNTTINQEELHAALGGMGKVCTDVPYSS